MKIHEQDMSSSLLKNVKDLKPSNKAPGTLERLTMFISSFRKLAPLIKLMMIPDAWSKEEDVEKSSRFI